MKEKMKVRMVIGLVLACVVMLTGCGKSESGSGGDSGNSHERIDSGRGREKMVQKLYAVIQSGDRDAERKFAEDNFAPGFGEKLRYKEYAGAKDVKKTFGKIAKSKETVETKVMKTKTESGGGEVSIIEAKCDDTTLYFVVGCEKGEADKIMFITADRNVAMRGDDGSGSKGAKAQSFPAQAAGRRAYTTTQRRKVSDKEAARLLLDQLRESMEISGLPKSKVNEKMFPLEIDVRDHENNLPLIVKGLQKGIVDNAWEPCVSEEYEVLHVKTPHEKTVLEYAKSRNQIGTDLAQLVFAFRALSEAEQEDAAAKLARLMKNQTK